MDANQISDFRELIWDYYRVNGRDLPWRHDPTPYQVFVSEIMLQQTQVARVMTKYTEWLVQFPSFSHLASAPTAQVLSTWQGLGYNRRALWTHRAAQQIDGEFGGQLPADPAVLVTLPGIGPNTAASIAAFAFNVPVVFIETNIRRVFIHHFYPDGQVKDAELMPVIAAALDHEHPREWYYALMDYGSHLAKTIPNPNRRSRHYAVQSTFEGSVRQLRGEVLRRLSDGRAQTIEQAITDDRLPAVLTVLASEGFIEHVNGSWQLHA